MLNEKWGRLLEKIEENPKNMHYSLEDKMKFLLINLDLDKSFLDLNKVLVKLKSGIEIKLKANKKFKNGKYDKAKEWYVQALQNFNLENEIISEKFIKILNSSSLEQIKYECMINITVCSTALKDYETALLFCGKIFKIKRKDFKTLNLKAKVLIYLERYKDAASVIRAALNRKYNASLVNYLKMCESKYKIEKQITEVIEENITLEDMSTDRERSSVKSNSKNEEKIILKNESEKKELKNLPNNYNQSTQFSTNMIYTLTKSILFKIIKIIAYSLKNFLSRKKFLVILIATAIYCYYRS